MNPSGIVEELVEVGRYENRRALYEHALVLVAVIGEYYEEANDDGCFGLFVRADQAVRARRELEEYDAESKNWPPPEPRLRDESPNMWLALIYAAVLMGVYILQLKHGREFEAALLSDAHGLWRRGEIWRPFTALFLHADLRHLFGNVAAVLLYVTMLNRMIPPVKTWTLVLGAGVLGNITTAAFHFVDGHKALGASTAVFGALGALAGVAIRTKFFASGGRRRSWLLPVGGSLALLGWTGAGGADTDVLAHAAGFVWGLVLGYS